MLDNYDLNGRIVAASAYAPSGQQQRAINYGSTAIEDLTQILEYFPDKLKANTLTPEQSRFVLAALRDASENIDRVMALMPAEVVERARSAGRRGEPENSRRCRRTWRSSTRRRSARR